MPTIPTIPLGPLAIAALAAVAWIGPDEHRPELLTVAAVLGAALSAGRSSHPVDETVTETSPPPPSTRARVLPTRLSDDELRAAIAAW